MSHMNKQGERELSKDGQQWSNGSLPSAGPQGCTVGTPEWDENSRKEHTQRMRSQK